MTEQQGPTWPQLPPPAQAAQSEPFWRREPGAGWLVVALVVAAGLWWLNSSGAGTAVSTPQPTAEPSQTVAELVRDYVRTYGGEAYQYEIIFDARCPELANLMRAQSVKMDREPAESPLWRRALGYANAINERQLEIDC